MDNWAMNNKCWAIQWISAESDMYEQIDTTGVYLSTRSVLKAINEIIQDKKRDIEEEGVMSPSKFGEFTEEILNEMKIGDDLPLWRYHDAMVIVVARPISF
jgi:hypothetical protein